ncbi:MAG: hypothetical protein IKQ15_05095 [Kiritimatiellae bacterium]|nr:hypothetical protein [Kiritimatiellia bacterium]
MVGKNGPDFPMVGKNFRAFSNDWKSFSGRFWETKGTKGATKQGVDKECQTIMTISGNSSRRQLGQLQECLECRFADLIGWETGGMPT